MKQAIKLEEGLAVSKELVEVMGLAIKATNRTKPIKDFELYL